MGAGAIAGALIGLAGTAYATIEQKKSSRKAREAQSEADLTARRIAAGQKPIEETATLQMDTGANTNALDALGLTIEPNKRPKAGLGLANSNSLPTTNLGFGS